MADDDEIYCRRFGPKFANPCADPNMIECANYECQAANRCRKSFNLEPGREADMHSLTARHFTE